MAVRKKTLKSHYSSPSHFPQNRENLTIVTELGDRAAQGRAFGNLGNTHYLLGNFRSAVLAHEQVQQRASKEFCSSKVSPVAPDLKYMSCVGSYWKLFNASFKS